MLTACASQKTSKLPDPQEEIPTRTSIPTEIPTVTPTSEGYEFIPARVHVVELEDRNRIITINSRAEGEWIIVGGSEAIIDDTIILGRGEENCFAVFVSRKSETHTIKTLDPSVVVITSFEKNAYEGLSVLEALDKFSKRLTEWTPWCPAGTETLALP